MLSAIVLTHSDADPAAGRAQEAIVRSLAALVGAAVADVVRDACIAGPPGARLAAISDHAGSALVEEADVVLRLEKAVRAARGERVFVLMAGYAPLSGFIDEMSDWSLSASPPAMALRAEPDSLARRIFPALAPCVGIVAVKKDLLATRADGPAALVRKLRARTLVTRARRVV